MDSEALKKIQSVWQNAEVLHDEATVERAFDTMAAAITEKLADSNPLCLAVMNGGIVPAGRLLTRLPFPLQLDSAHATRYRNKTSGRELVWKKYPDSDLKGRTVLVIDDILDEGITVKAVVDYCREQGAAEIYSAIMVDKLDARHPDGLQTADFVGLQIPKRYVFGYGLDYHGYLRNAPGIYAVNENDL